MILFSNVTKEFGEHTVLDNVNFKIEPGEFVCLTGPSGAGKSTILHLLIRAEVPTTGMIEVDGADLSKLPPSLLQMYRRRTGVVFQDHRLLADRTVEENVAFALEAGNATDADIEERVAELLDLLGIAHRADAFPRELSGGEKTRAALARALAHNPSILIADEPTGNIDPDQTTQILQILRELHEQGTTVILATHEASVVDALNVRVIRLEAGKVVRDSVGGYVMRDLPQAPLQKIVTTGSTIQAEEEPDAELAEEQEEKSEPSAPAAPPQLKQMTHAPGRYVPKQKNPPKDVPNIPQKQIPENDMPDTRGHIRPIEIQ